MDYIYSRSLATLNLRRLQLELLPVFIDVTLTYHSGPQLLVVKTALGDPGLVVAAHNPVPDIPIDVHRAFLKIKEQIEAAETVSQFKVAMLKSLRLMAYLFGEYKPTNTEYDIGILDVE